MPRLDDGADEKQQSSQDDRDRWAAPFHLEAYILVLANGCWTTDERYGTLNRQRTHAVLGASLGGVLALSDKALAKRLEAWREKQTAGVATTPKDDA